MMTSMPSEGSSVGLAVPSLVSLISARYGADLVPGPVLGPAPLLENPNLDRGGICPAIGISWHPLPIRGETVVDFSLHPHQKAARDKGSASAGRHTPY